MEGFCGKVAAVEALLQKFGFATAEKPKDKFNRYGRISHILSLIQLLLDQNDYDTLEVALNDVKKQMN